MFAQQPPLRVPPFSSISTRCARSQLIVDDRTVKLTASDSKRHLVWVRNETKKLKKWEVTSDNLPLR